MDASPMGTEWVPIVPLTDRQLAGVQEYRAGYPSSLGSPMVGSPAPEISAAGPNAAFLDGVGKAQPSGLTISEMHAVLRGNYSALEDWHHFVQWFFPIPEAGMNAESRALTGTELLVLSGNSQVKLRIRESVAIMLDFFGLGLGQ